MCKDIFAEFGMKPLEEPKSSKDKVPCIIVEGRFKGYTGKFSITQLINKKHRGKHTQFNLTVLPENERLRYMKNTAEQYGYNITVFPVNGRTTCPMEVISREGKTLKTTWNTLESNLARKGSYNRTDLRESEAYKGYIYLWEQKYETTVLDEYQGNHTKLRYKHLSGEYKGLIGMSEATSFREMREPTLRSLTPESRLQYCKTLCDRAGHEFISVSGEPIGVATEINYKINNGLYQGYVGSTTVSTFRRTLDDKRSFRTFGLLKSGEQLLFVNNFIQDAGYKVKQLPEPFRVTKKVAITCPNGHEWTPIWDNFLRGARCPKCSPEFRGERLVASILKGATVTFDRQYPVKTHSSRIQFFDFYLPDYKIAIEYNGKQHYEPVEFFGGEKAFKLNQARDQAKRDYCAENSITLLELPYTLTDQEVKEKIIQTIS